MNLPRWLLRLLPLFEYICPKCRTEVKPNSHTCPHCDERFPLAIRVPPSFLKDSKKLEAYVHKHVFPRISEFERNYLTKYFTVLFSDGFDDNTFNAWTSTSGSPTIVTSPVHHGGYAVKLTGAAGGGWCNCRKDFAGQSDCYARWYMQFPSLGNTNNEAVDLSQFWTANWSERVRAIYTNTGNTILGLGTPSGTSWVAVVISINTWYCFDLRRKVGAGNGIATLWLDGVQQITRTADTITGNSAIFLLQTAGQASNEFTSYCDCVVVADTGPIGPEVEERYKGWSDWWWNRKILAAKPQLQNRFPRPFSRPLGPLGFPQLSPRKF